MHTSVNGTDLVAAHRVPKDILDHSITLSPENQDFAVFPGLHGGQLLNYFTGGRV